MSTLENFQTSSAPRHYVPSATPELITEHLGRHRLWTIALTLKCDANGNISNETVAALRRFEKETPMLLTIDRERGTAYVTASKGTLSLAFSPRSEAGKPQRLFEMVTAVVDGKLYRTTTGCAPSLPAYLAPHVTQISGFDTRPTATLAVRGNDGDFQL